MACCRLRIVEGERADLWVYVSAAASASASDLAFARLLERRTCGFRYLELKF